MLAGCGMSAVRVFKSSPFCLYSGKMPWSHAADSGIFALGEGKGGENKINGSISTLQGVKKKNLCSMSWAQLCPLLHTGVYIGRAGLFVSNLQHSIHYQELKCIFLWSLSLPLFVFLPLQLISINRHFLCCLVYSLKVPINFVQNKRTLLNLH